MFFRTIGEEEEGAEQANVQIGRVANILAARRDVLHTEAFDYMMISEVGGKLHSGT